jgi:hypothetical protein
MATTNIRFSFIYLLAKPIWLLSSHILQRINILTILIIATFITPNIKAHKENLIMGSEISYFLEVPRQGL